MKQVALEAEHLQNLDSDVSVETVTKQPRTHHPEASTNDKNPASSPPPPPQSADEACSMKKEKKPWVDDDDNSVMEVATGVIQAEQDDLAQSPAQGNRPPFGAKGAIAVQKLMSQQQGAKEEEVASEHTLTNQTEHGDHDYAMEVAATTLREAESKAYSVGVDNAMHQGSSSSRLFAAEELPAETTLRVALSHRQQEPGAYMENTRGGLQRTQAFNHDLVGASPHNHDSAMPSPVIRDDQLPVANPVQEESARMHAKPVDLEAQATKQQEQKNQRHPLLFMLILAALGVGTIIGVGTMAGNQKPNPDPTAYRSLEPTQVPSSSPTGSLDVLLDALPNPTQEKLQNSTTSQWKAWQWLAHHQNISILPDWKKEQLFALASFFYSFGGEH